MRKLVSAEQAVEFIRYMRGTNVLGYINGLADLLTEPPDEDAEGVVINHQAVRFHAIKYARDIRATLRIMMTLEEDAQLTDISDTLHEVEARTPREQRLAQRLVDDIAKMQASGQSEIRQMIDVTDFERAIFEGLTEYPNILADIYTEQYPVTLEALNEGLRILKLTPVPRYTGDQDHDERVYQEAMDAMTYTGTEPMVWGSSEKDLWDRYPIDKRIAELKM